MHTTRDTLLLVGILFLGAACAAAPERSPASSRELFDDPSKFENLVSGPYEARYEVSPDIVQALATKPVPVLDGDSLFSEPFNFANYGPADEVPDMNRAPASEPISDSVVSSPNLAYAMLVKGNERFVNGTATGARRDANRRREIASAQNPFAVVLSCSDSRVPPELIFDQGLGDLYTIRVAGNVLGSAQVASIEYAVQHLGAKLILVLGHESCGAVQAAIDAKGKSKLARSESPDMAWLVSAIRPALQARGLASVAPDDPKIRKPVMANIDSVTENLVVRSQIIGDAIARGDLKVVRGIYSLDTGRVDFWGLK